MPIEEKSPSASIFEAVKLGKIDELESLIKRGFSLNEINESRDNFTPLHCACYFGSLESLHWLLWKGADTTVCTPKGWTSTHIAAIRGQYACIQALIQSGVNINAKDYRGQTPSHLASTHGNSQTLQALIRAGADLTIQDANGWTPVHTSAYYGRLGCLQFLKTGGGKLDECDSEGNTPAHLAAMEGNLHCLKYILSNVRSGMTSILSARNDQGDTPKTLGEQFFKKDIVDYLEALEWERDHPEQAENLAFPAHVAAFNGDLTHLKLLIEQGVININERDDKGCTPAHKACGQGHLEVLQWLIENGANVNIRNSAGETPRDVALRFAQLACSKLLERETLNEDDNENLNEAQSEEAAQSSIVYSKDQKRAAKERAKKKVQEIEKLLSIARSNYEQLGGKPEDTNNLIASREQAALREQARTIAELENDLEVERLKREKLEAQLDKCRQEIERCVGQLRQYERKIDIMEKYYDHMNNKNENKSTSSKKSVSKKKKKSIKSENSYEDYERVKRVPTQSSAKKVDVSLDHLNLTVLQEKELREAFNEIDTNSSGFISVNELKSAYDQLEIKIDESDLKSIIDLLDINDDGRISFIEFAEVTAKKFYQKYTKRELVEAFKEFDQNDSGHISMEELRQVLSKKGRLYSKEQVAKLVDSIDKDKNGLVSIDEFSRLLN